MLQRYRETWCQLTWRPAGYSTPADLQDHVTGSCCSSWNTCRGWWMSCIFNVSDMWALWFVVLTGFHRKAVHFHLTRRYLDLFILFVYFCTSLHRNSSTDKQRWRQGTRSFSNPPPHAKMMGSKSCFILKNRQKNPRLLKCFLTALLPNLQGQQWTSSAPDCSSATVWWVSMKFCRDIFIVPQIEERRRDCMNCEEFMSINLITYHRTNPPELIFTFLNAAFLEHYPYLHINTTFISQNLTISM